MSLAEYSSPVESRFLVPVFKTKARPSRQFVDPRPAATRRQSTESPLESSRRCHPFYREQCGPPYMSPLQLGRFCRQVTFVPWLFPAA